MSIVNGKKLHRRRRRKVKAKLTREEPELGLKPCLFCESKYVRVEGDSGGGYVWLMCLDCGTTGPSALNRWDATQWWNDRKVPPNKRLPAQ